MIVGGGGGRLAVRVAAGLGGALGNDPATIVPITPLPSLPRLLAQPPSTFYLPTD